MCIIKTLSKIIILTLVLNFIVKAYAKDLYVENEQSFNQWTLENSITKALNSNPDVQIVKQELERQVGRHIQIRSVVLPKVSMVARASSREDSTIDRSPGELKVPIDQRTAIAQESYTAGIEIRQLLFDGFSSFKQIKSSDLLKQATYWKIKDVTNRVIEDVKKIYDQSLYAHRIIKINTESVAIFEELLQIENKKRDAGEISDLRILQLTAELDKAKAKVAEANSDLINYEKDFIDILALDNEVFREDGHLDLQGSFFYQKSNYNISSLVSKISQMHPDVIMYRLQKESARVNLDSTKISYLPKVEAFANYDVRSSYYDVNKNLDGWTVGIQGRVSLFDGFNYNGSMRVARANLNIAEIKLAEKKRNLKSQVEKIYDKINTFKIVIDSKLSSVSSSQRALNEALKLYDEGEISVKEVLEAELNLREMQRDLNKSILDSNLLTYQMEYMVNCIE